jgi:hypothetical protein
MESWKTRRVFTFLAAVATFAALAGVTSTVVSRGATPNESFLLACVWGCLSPLFLGTAYCAGKWSRTQSGDRTRKPFCPRCDYNLRGLSEARCPECGERFTLEQLWSAWVRAYVGVENENEL